MQAALSKAAAENTVCPLAAWGAAHSYQADYNGIFMEPDNVDAKLQLAGEQLAALENPTEMEKLVIAAEQARGADPDAKAYVTAMKAAFDALPNDPDVAALFAHAVMLQRPWSLFELKAGVDGKPPLPPSEDFLFGTQAALDAIAQGLVVSPDHPGLLHLWIHAAEMGSYGMIEACRPGSDRLLNVSRGTACGHLLHMPAHIYCLQGDWQAAIEANVLAVEADKQVVALDPEREYFFHKHLGACGRRAPRAWADAKVPNDASRRDPRDPTVRSFKPLGIRRQHSPKKKDPRSCRVQQAAMVHSVPLSQLAHADLWRDVRWAVGNRDAVRY